MNPVAGLILVLALLLAESFFFLALLRHRGTRLSYPLRVSPEARKQALPAACMVWTLLGRPAQPSPALLAQILAGEASRSHVPPSQCLASLTRAVGREELLAVWSELGPRGLTELLREHLD